MAKKSSSKAKAASGGAGAAASAASSVSDSSSTPVAAARKSGKSGPSSAKQSPNQRATFDLPASLCARPDLLDTADLTAFVPDPQYLKARIPQQDKCRRIMRRVFWAWNIHTVAAMFDPFEIVILNTAGIAVAGAISLYCASTIASLAF